MIFGTGILRGMGVTLKNFFLSYFASPDKGGLFTVEYPEKRLPDIPGSRNFPFLVYDKNSDDLRCTACEICAKECPTKCIFILRDTDQEGKPLKKPRRFEIDYGMCMNCGLCEEVCPFDSIYLGDEFEIAHPGTTPSLVYSKEKLAKPNEYFRKIRPADAKAIDEKREALARKKAAASQGLKP